jgi:peptide/nickel transport system permease protein
MGAFISRRLLLGLIVLFGVVLITFVLTRIVPSDPAAEWVGPRSTPAQHAQARKELGLDRPLYVQFVIYLGDLSHGNLGFSLDTHQAVSSELAARLPATIELVIVTFFIATLIGLPLGVISAKRKDKWPDHLSRIFSVGFVSMPTFWVALFLQLIFYSRLGWLPAGGQTSTNIQVFYDVPTVTHFLLVDSLISGNFVVFKDALIHMVLPVIALSAYPIGLVARMTRSAMLEILNEDYITAARSYGLPERQVLWVSALKNSLGPTVTVVTLSIGYTLVNTFLVEAIFSWPGIGNYIATAVTTLNYPAIMGVTIFSAVAYIILNLVADIIIALDPRVRV